MKQPAEKKTVKDILIEYLKQNGFDGLYSPGECGCSIEDLNPCGSDCILACLPGIRKESTSDEYDYMVGPKENREKVERTLT
jgi:hypothetical protein